VPGPVYERNGQYCSAEESVLELMYGAGESNGRHVRPCSSITPTDVTLNVAERPE